MAKPYYTEDFTIAKSWKIVGGTEATNWRTTYIPILDEEAHLTEMINRASVFNGSGAEQNNSKKQLELWARFFIWLAARPWGKAKELPGPFPRVRAPTSNQEKGRSPTRFECWELEQYLATPNNGREDMIDAILEDRDFLVSTSDTSHRAHGRVLPTSAATRRARRKRVLRARRQREIF